MSKYESHSKTLNTYCEKHSDIIESCHSEYDGCFSSDKPAYWVYLQPGYIAPRTECGTIHEPTVKACLSEIRDVLTVEQWEKATGFKYTG